MTLDEAEDSDASLLILASAPISSQDLHQDRLWIYGNHQLGDHLDQILGRIP
jgi:hypothetical protein